MRRKRLNKRADSEESGHVMVGLALLLLILASLLWGIVKFGDEIISYINSQVKKGIEKVVNPKSLYSSASVANFERLNEEVLALIERKSSTAYSVVPYTLGQYRLVGFNKDSQNGINIGCLGSEMAAIKPKACNNAACLCLCYMEESCECEVYPQVDYIITTENQYRNKAEKLESVKDPVTGDDAYCLMIKGAPQENEEIPKTTVVGSLWWGSNNVYLEKSESDGRTYLFFSRYQDIEYTERVFTGCNPLDIKSESCVNVLSCADYKNIDLGCDWKYTCQKNVCPYVGKACKVLENPYAVSEAEEALCVGQDENLDGFCIAGPEENSVQASGKKGDLVWADEIGLCFRCVGLGLVEEGADNWGWGQDPTINKDNCVTPAPSP